MIIDEFVYYQMKNRHVGTWTITRKSKLDALKRYDVELVEDKYRDRFVALEIEDMRFIAENCDIVRLKKMERGRFALFCKGGFSESNCEQICNMANFAQYSLKKKGAK